MAEAVEQLFYATVAGGRLESMLGGEAPAHLRRARDLLQGKPRLPGALDLVRRHLRRHLQVVFVPDNLRPELRALFPERMENVRAHRVWIDHVFFERGSLFPTIDARALVRLPMRHPIRADALAALEEEHQDSLWWACNFEVGMPGDDTAWLVSHEGFDVIPIDHASDIAKLPRLPREAREAREYIRKVEQAFASAKVPLRARR